MPPGSNFGERRRQNLRQMDRSQEIAAAVALRELGYDVEAEPEGALVVAVAEGAPAAGKLEPDRRDRRRRRQGRAHAGRPPPPDRHARAGRDASASGSAAVTGRARSRSGRSRARGGGRPIVGVQVEQSADIKLPIDVEIDLGGVGGPSAGLAFALDIVEELRGDVDRGLKVAATGEIELDGDVLPIGGVKQKVIGARRSGADVFLVPAGDNAAEARRHAGDLPDHACGEFSTGVASAGNCCEKRVVSSAFRGGRILRKLHGFPQKGA